MRTAARAHVEILVLGAGWTFTFLLPLLEKESVRYAATSTTGRDDTIPFRFDSDSDNIEPFKTLPTATTVLITFPLTGHGQATKLVDLYTRSRSSVVTEGAGPPPDVPFFIQFGATSIFTDPSWNTRKSPHDTSIPRAQAEDELLSLSHAPRPIASSTVLNLAGLYGGQRIPKNWVPRIIKTKKDLEGRKALHLVHGVDVARAVLGTHRARAKMAGERWIVTDLHVYDWWELIYGWAAEGSGMESAEVFVKAPPAARGNRRGRRQAEVRADTKAGESAQEPEEDPEKETIRLRETLFECMLDQGVRALPRGPEQLGRVLDARDFWQTVGLLPSIGRTT